MARTAPQNTIRYAICPSSHVLSASTQKLHSPGLFVKLLRGIHPSRIREPRRELMLAVAEQPA